MTEHVHEWEIKTEIEHGGTVEVWIQCADKKCHHVEYKEQAETRLNATERLSAETARNLLEAYKTGQINMYFAMSTIRSTLKAYADILEGKDAQTP